MEVDARGLRRARIRAQRLSGSSRGGADEVARAVVGVQAQDRGAAGLAIRVRSGGARASDVARAWSLNGPLVLTWSLRGTRHLHHRDDVRWLLSIFGPMYAAGSPGRNRQLGIEGAAGDRAVRAVRDALRRRGPLTRPQVKDVLARHGLDVSGQALIHILARAALEGGASASSRTTTTRRPTSCSTTACRSVFPGREDALAESARRYLRAYGPATPADLAVWSGIGQREADAAWSAITGELGGGLHARRSDVDPEGIIPAIAAAVRSPAPIRLLPAFDTLLLGYADRTPLVPARFARRVNAGGGMIRPDVLTDDGVVGTWSLRRERDRTSRVKVDPFGRLRPGVREGFDREVRSVARFIGS